MRIGVLEGYIMFITRLISGIVLVALMFAANYVGGYVWLGLIFLAAMLGVFEMYRVFGIAKKPTGIIGFIITIAYYAVLMFDRPAYIMPLLCAFVIVELIAMIVTYPKTPVSEVGYGVLGMFYVAVLFSAMYLLRIEEQGFFLVWLVFIGAWGSDTFAYCAGMLFGKHKAFPVLSPKKSWEGCVGGVVGAALLGFVYALIFQNKLSELNAPLVFVPIISACTSVLSQCGDLSASAIKRQFGIKDYGTLIPGHGGIMDRFDSILFAGPAIYYLLKLFCL